MIPYKILRLDKKVCFSRREQKKGQGEKSPSFVNYAKKGEDLRGVNCSRTPSSVTFSRALG